MKKFKKVYTVSQALKDPRVDDMYYEIGNFEYGKKDWWIHLKEGYMCEYMECGTIHEPTVKRCLDLLNTDIVTEEQFYSLRPRCL